jgi:hypothetical protein
MLTHVAGVVRDSHPFDGTPFSSREVKRFFGMVLDLAIAGRLELKWLARQRNKATFLQRSSVKLNSPRIATFAARVGSDSTRQMSTL